MEMQHRSLNTRSIPTQQGKYCVSEPTYTNLQRLLAALLLPKDHIMLLQVCCLCLSRFTVLCNVPAA